MPLLIFIIWHLKDSQRSSIFLLNFVCIWFSEDVVLIIEQQQVAIRNLEQNQRKLLDNVVKLKRTNKRLLSLVQGRCSLYQTCNQIYGVYAKDDKQMARGNIKNGVENSQPCNAGSCNCKTKISEKDDDLQKRLLVNGRLTFYSIS